MRRSFLVMFMLVWTVCFVVQTASAQLIKVPKIPKPNPSRRHRNTQPARQMTQNRHNHKPETRTTSSAASPGAGGPYLLSQNRR